MDDEEMTPLPKPITKDAMVSRSPHEVMSTVRAEQFFVQCRPGWQGQAEAPPTASYVTQVQMQTPSPLPERAGSEHYFHLGL